MGYFINYYNASKHIDNEDNYYRDVPQSRMKAYKGSEIYRKSSGFCKNDFGCKNGDEICHRASPKWLEEETKLSERTPVIRLAI